MTKDEEIKETLQEVKFMVNDLRVDNQHMSEKLRLVNRMLKLGESYPLGETRVSMPSCPLSSLEKLLS